MGGRWWEFTYGRLLRGFGGTREARTWLWSTIPRGSMWKRRNEVKVGDVFEVSGVKVKFRG